MMDKVLIYEEIKDSMHVNYDLNKNKIATDEATFARAVGLYESDKVTEVETVGGYYSAAVL